MGEVLTRHPRRNYEAQTRTLRIGGRTMSIRLELLFWDTLEEMAAYEGTRPAQFLATLHDQISDHLGEVENFASVLRCCCLHYRSMRPKDADLGVVDGSNSICN